MSLQLYAPGTRKNNRYWLVRGHYDGRLIERSAGTGDKAIAKRFLRELERELAAEELPRPGDIVSFAQAAELYAAFRGIDLANRGVGAGGARERAKAAGIRRLVAVLGREPIGEITHAHLVAAANRLYPGKAAATKNREALRPAAAILHYAANNGMCPWLRVALFREPRPKTRAVTLDVAAALVDAAGGADDGGWRRLVLLWLFRQGTRISDTLRVRWDDIDLPRQTVRIHIHKTDTRIELPLHPELVEQLAAIPAAARAKFPPIGPKGGRLFPWTQKTGVYRWLRPLARERGVAFTPHMARHSVGTWLNESGAGLRTIMAALGHADVKSSVRYQAADVEIVRAAAAKLGDIRPRRAAG